MTMYGYARVSTREQENDLQLDALNRAKCDVILQEKASGASQKGRPELARCLSLLSRGDVLVVYKIDRIARSLFDLLDILRRLERVGATIKSVTEPLDTTSSMGLFVVQMLGAVAQLERSMIRERSIAGQIAARERGREPGRVRSLESEAEARVVAEYRAGGVTYRELAKRNGVSESVVKRAVYRVTKGADHLKRGKV
ncbi:recombinase family protein [Variovorax sp. EBFNA2]|uniref:recombinase family protein n=1 Tax=Variovorax sp. EBFNA2 TaxID=3342097 RepID=UPI0029C0EABF|nr:recombinase family protein [Variovorax boronicumulans]WPG40315.1 recombinase family protein [Variovorax boronicumulans]